MLWACILLPQLALDGVLRRHPDPVSPLALVTGPAQRRVLRAVNGTAKAAGLRAGQSLGTAQALCSRFDVIAYDPAEDERWHDFLAAWAYRYSSLVSRTMPSALLLEVEASFKLFGPWPRFEAQLRADLGELGFRHRITLAPNPYAARALANVHDGLAITHDVPLHNALGQLPVERSGLATDVSSSLRRMGLRKLGQVLALPRAALGKRVGKDTLAHLDRLTGALPTPLRYYQPPDAFTSRIELNYDVESSQALLFPLRRLTGDLAAYLAGRDLSEINLEAWKGVSLAHYDGGMPNSSLIVETMNTRTLGEVIHFFERATGISCYMQGVNPFDQPGVEAYKANMFALLGKPGFEAQAKALRARL